MLIPIAITIFTLASGLGPLDFANPSNSLTAFILFGVAGFLFVLAGLPTGAVQKLSATYAIEGTVLFGIALFLLNQGKEYFLAGNLLLAGVFLLAGVVMGVFSYVTASGQAATVLQALEKKE